MEAWTNSYFWKVLRDTQLLYISCIVENSVLKQIVSHGHIEKLETCSVATYLKTYNFLCETNPVKKTVSNLLFKVKPEENVIILIYSSLLNGVMLTGHSFTTIRELHEVFHS